MTAMTVAAWVKLSDYNVVGGGGPVFVKDPSGNYLTWLYILNDGTLYASSGALDLGGIGARSVVASGSGYAVNDTGVVIGGSPDTPANEATYQVLTISGSTVLTVGIVGPGTGYAAGQTYATQKTSGAGNNALTISVSTLVNRLSALSQSNETVPLNAFTHVAMTWDSSVDGLIRLYINGVECTYQSARTRSKITETSAGPWYIGDDHAAFTINAAIAEVAIYNTALSGAAVTALAASTSGATGSPVDYWHLCGLASPEPNSANPTNFGTLSVPAPAKGPNSPGYQGCVIIVSTKESVGLGQFGGTTLAKAFFNPSSFDLIQILNEGGQCVWKLSSAGVVSVNPVSKTAKALWTFFGASFALAFPNPLAQDILQVVGPGQVIHFWIDSTGAAHTA